MRTEQVNSFSRSSNPVVGGCWACESPMKERFFARKSNITHKNFDRTPTIPDRVLTLVTIRNGYDEGNTETIDV